MKIDALRDAFAAFVKENEVGDGDELEASDLFDALNDAADGFADFDQLVEETLTALRHDGVMLCCDVDPEFLEVLVDAARALEEGEEEEEDDVEVEEIEDVDYDAVTEAPSDVSIAVLSDIPSDELDDGDVGKVEDVVEEEDDEDEHGDGVSKYGEASEDSKIVDGDEKEGDEDVEGDAKEAEGEEEEEEEEEKPEPTAIYVSAEEPAIFGYMKKLTRRKRWVIRFYVLYGLRLDYYKFQQDYLSRRPARGRLLLETADAAVLPDTFQLRLTLLSDSEVDPLTGAAVKSKKGKTGYEDGKRVVLLWPSAVPSGWTQPKDIQPAMRWFEQLQQAGSQSLPFIYAADDSVLRTRTVLGMKLRLGGGGDNKNKSKGKAAAGEGASEDASSSTSRMLVGTTMKRKVVEPHAVTVRRAGYDEDDRALMTAHRRALYLGYKFHPERHAGGHRSSLAYPAHVGYVKKQGGGHRWRRRWRPRFLVLYGSRLDYFEYESDYRRNEPHLGRVELHGATVGVEPFHAEFLVSVTASDGRVLKFRPSAGNSWWEPVSSSDVAAQEWKARLEDAGREAVAEYEDEGHAVAINERMLGKLSSFYGSSRRAVKKDLVPPTPRS